MQMSWKIVKFLSNHSSAFPKYSVLYDSVSSAKLETTLGVLAQRNLSVLAQRNLIRELLMGLRCWQGHSQRETWASIIHLASAFLCASSLNSHKTCCHRRTWHKSDVRSSTHTCNYKDAIKMLL